MIYQIEMADDDVIQEVTETGDAMGLTEKFVDA
jgi:hypothetical protein